MTEITEWWLKKVFASGNTSDEIPLNTKNTYTCGRSRENDIVCKSDLVSRKHCLFFRNERNLYVQDLKSGNGIFINGQKQKPQIMVPLKNGDIIGIGITEEDSSDSQKFIYRLYKQVVVDLERECVKKEIAYCGKEDYHLPSKLFKFSETTSDIQQHIAVQNLEYENDTQSISNHKTSSKIVSEKVCTTSSSVKMSFEIMVSKGYKGPMPNVFVNQIPVTNSSKGLQISANRPTITENQSSQLEWIKAPFLVPNSLVGAKAVSQNEAVFQEREKVIKIPEDISITNCSTAFTSNNKSITEKNSNIQITEFSQRKTIPLISTIDKEPSSPEKEISLTQNSVKGPQEVEILEDVDHPKELEIITEVQKINEVKNAKEVEKAEEATQIQMHQQNPDSTNAENEKNESNPSSHDTDSDTSMTLCSSTTKISRSNTSEENHNQDMTLGSTSSKKRSFIAVQRNSIGEKREVSSFMDQDDKGPRISAKRKKESVTQDLRSTEFKVQKIVRNADESDSEEEGFQVPISDDENDMDENQKLNNPVNDIDCRQGEEEILVEYAKVTESEELKILEVPVTRNVDPRTCSPKRQQESDDTNNSNNDNNTSDEVSKGEYNPAWEKAHNAIVSLNNNSNQNVPLTSYPNPFPNCQLPYPVYPNSYSNPQNLNVNQYQNPYPSVKFPFLNYLMQNYQNPYQNYQTSFINYPPPCLSNQSPFLVGQIPCPVPYPNFQISQLNNQSPTVCAENLSVPNSSSAEKVEEENAKHFEENTEEKTHQAGGVDFKNKKATPKVISFEKVNLEYKSHLNLQPKPQIPEENKNLKTDELHVQETTTVKKKEPSLAPKPAMKLEPLHISSPRSESAEENNNLKTSKTLQEEAAKKWQTSLEHVGKLETYIPTDQLFRSSSKSDEVLMNIVSWKPAEFESCFCKEVPCILNPENTRKTQMVYSNHDDYCDIQIPLILVNISYKVKSAYKVSEERATFLNCKIVRNSVSLIWIEDTKSYMMGFDIKVCGSKLNAHKPPKIGDFLRIDITKDETNFRTLIFAYVANVRDVVHYEFDPDPLKMTIGVVTKLIEFNLYKSKIKELSVIMSLLPSINLVKALEQLKESPLLPMILNPEPEDYELGSYLNPDLKALLQTSSTPGLLEEENLNYNQLSAVRKLADEAIRREPKVALIQGAPGTGKTRVIVDTVIEILNGKNYNQNKNRTMKILLCAVSDSEVDEILHRLYYKKKYLQCNKTLKMVRIGLLEQMSSRAKDLSVEELARKHVESSLKELSAKGSAVPHNQELKQLYGEKKLMQGEIEIKNNRNAILRLAILSTYLDIIESGRNVSDIYDEEYKSLLEVAEQTFLLGANVIVCTLDMCYSPKMDAAFRDEHEIPVLIVEDATQSLESDLFKPLTFGVQTLILVGDSCKRSTKYINLPILESHGFTESLFSRLKMKLENYIDSPIIKLQIQYRMNRKIAFFPNKFFHQGKVRNDVESGQTFPLISYRVFNFKTSKNFEANEATFVATLMQCIMLYAEFKNVPKPLRIGVITASSSSKLRIETAIQDQLDLISQNKRNFVVIEVDIMEKFKNQERDVIFASCLRPRNGQRFIDFQRLYSMITLAKHSLILFGKFRKFGDETTSLWNCLIDDAVERKMFIDIEARPHPAQLKMHILR